MTPIERKLAKVREDIEVVTNLLKIRGSSRNSEHRMMLHVLQRREQQLVDFIERAKK